MRILTALSLVLVSSQASAADPPMLGAAFFSAALRLEPAPLGDLALDASLGLEGVLVRFRPLCPGLLVGFDADSDGQGTSEVHSVEIPILARAGLCTAGDPVLLHAWLGAGISYVSVTTAVAGVTRTDGAVASLFALGLDGLVRWRRFAGLVGVSGDLSNDRWAIVARLGLGTWL